MGTDDLDIAPVAIQCCLGANTAAAGYVDQQAGKGSGRFVRDYLGFRRGKGGCQGGGMGFRGDRADLPGMFQRP